jgi:hypothetical protein
LATDPQPEQLSSRDLGLLAGYVIEGATDAAYLRLCRALTVGRPPRSIVAETPR